VDPLQALEQRVFALEKRAESVETKLDRILVLLEGSKVGAAVLKWLIAFGAGVAVIWGTFHGSK